MNKSIHIMATASLVVCLNTAVHAEWYLGIDQIPASNWHQIDDYSIDTTNTDFDAYALDHNFKDNGFKFYSGYKAHDLLTLEFEYKDQMEFGVGNVFSGRELWLSNEDNTDLESKTLFLSGSSTFVIDEGKRIHVRGGLYNWDLKPDSDYFGDNPDAKKNGTDIFYSIGSYFDVTEKIGFSAEWERFEFENEDVDFISTELRFSF